MPTQLISIRSKYAATASTAMLAAQIAISQARRLPQEDRGVMGFSGISGIHPLL